MRGSLSIPLVVTGAMLLSACGEVPAAKIIGVTSHDTVAADLAGGDSPLPPADLTGEAEGDGPGVDLPDCPFRACDSKDYPEIELGPCEKLAWDSATCDCAPFPKTAGTACDDGDPCSTQDRCDGIGNCWGDPADCDDDNPCTDDSCEPGVGCLSVPNQSSCEDGNPCTENDFCADGGCQPGPYASTCAECDPEEDLCETLYGDGDLCNGELVCVDGACALDSESIVFCDPSGLPPCGEMTCLPWSGECVVKTLPDGSPCDDGNFCTVDDFCDAGDCKGFLNPEVEGCGCEADEECGPLDDGDLCNGTLHCVDGICLADPNSVPPPCDPAGDEPCVLNLCNPGTGSCEIVQLGDGEPCDDGDACTVGDACLEGLCVPEEEVTCESLDNPCLEALCDPALGGCVVVPANEGAPCDIADPCALEGACVAGECAPSVPIDCSDGDPCTVDSCAEGECLHVPGGGEWTLLPLEAPSVAAPVGLPSMPGQLVFTLVNSAAVSQTFIVFESSATGEETDHPWVALDRRFLTVGAGEEGTFVVRFYPVLGALQEGTYEAFVAVRDACEAGAASALRPLELTVEPAEAEVLFEEVFDDNPFPVGRWAVFMGDCTNEAPGTVAFYGNAVDACGGPNGYVYREYKGDRCIEYQGPPFSTEGYSEVMLAYGYRLQGGSIKVSVRKDGSWGKDFAEAKASSMEEWAYKEALLNGVVDGIRFKLKAGGDDVRRLDCITIEGIPECDQVPTIVAEPEPITAPAGSSVMLSVTASGNNLSYQWMKGGEAIVDSDFIEGSLSPSLVLTAVGAGDGGKYRCVVSDDCGTAQSGEVLVVVVE